uniref:Uncharacterized protein n=1 Tax=Meloidogyne javanica TaxID=6303 RepID=A0A915M6C3_MELJA
MSEKTSLSFNDLSITEDSCCSTSCMFEGFNQRLQNLEEILNEKNKNVKKENNFEENTGEIKELNNELTKNKDLVSQLEIEKSANEKEFNLLLIQIGKIFLGNSTIKIIAEQPRISLGDKLALLTRELKKINEENNKVHFVTIPNKIDTSDYPFTIGFRIFLKENDNNLRPTIELEQISVETNFGNNLLSNPFSYDVHTHSEAIFSHY